MGKRGKGRRPNPTGRSKGEAQFVNLPYPMLQHVAWRSLSGPAVKVWLELRTRFNGSNNGQIYLSFNDAARLLHLSKSTVKRAFDELALKGFIQLRQEGNWYGRRATEWIVTDAPYRDVPATRAWQNWRPDDSDKKQNAVLIRPRYASNGAVTVPYDRSPLRPGTRET